MRNNTANKTNYKKDVKDLFMSNFNPSRRRFIKSAVIAGCLCISRPVQPRLRRAVRAKILQSPNWDPQTKRVRFRIDGRAKVMGQKVFARDIRAVDMPHWPQKQAHAFILRVTKADRLFEGSICRCWGRPAAGSPGDGGRSGARRPGLPGVLR